jgi:hypothetical protein
MYRRRLRVWLCGWFPLSMRREFRCELGFVPSLILAWNCPDQIVRDRMQAVFLKQRMEADNSGCVEAYLSRRTSLCLAEIIL